MSGASSTKKKKVLNADNRSSSQSLQQQPQPPGPAQFNVNIPLTCIDAAEVRDLFFVQILCKDGRFYLIQFGDSLVCKDWAYRISNAIAPPTSVEQVGFFALPLYLKTTKV